MSSVSAHRIAIGLALALGGCSPPHRAPPPPPRKAVAALPAPPPKVGTMICRSSIDGRAAKCGAADAVMVGIKFGP